MTVWGQSWNGLNPSLACDVSNDFDDDKAATRKTGKKNKIAGEKEEASALSELPDKARKKKKRKQRKKKKKTSAIQQPAEEDEVAESNVSANEKRKVLKEDGDKKTTQKRAREEG